ncbi:MAG: radical SAM family heme chaperone HemW [Actinomycetota bacterium]|nr:radical SAM family heme chaperone HemW [Actinomycetota bacterium]
MADPFGIYVHIPFCVERCDYCAFATWTDRSHLMGRYARACVRQAGDAYLPLASSVFFGGGTPSLLEPALFVEILDALPRRPDAEVTVECNPESVTPDLLATYRDAGVTRLSFGVQSMVAEVLSSLGRRHDPFMVRRAVAAAVGAGFGDAYSVDLIFGAAGESVDQWRRSLTETLTLDPPPSHVSAYGLTVEPGTPLAVDTRRHPDPDDQADKYELTDQLLGEAGLTWYEISNWARPGAECSHNRLYWRQGSYRGIGCAAHSHTLLTDGRSKRWWNVRTPERYAKLVEEGVDPEAASEVLDAGAQRWEGLTLALRTSEGVPVGALADDPLLDGLVRSSGGRSVLTLQGRLLANEVAARLLA